MKASGIRQVGLRLLTALVAAVYLSTVAPTFGADEEAAAGRNLLTKWQNAVVTIRLVSKERMAFGGRGMGRGDSTSEVTGTVMDSSGLTVVSLMATDPGQALAQMLGRMGVGGDEDARPKWESQITDAKIVLADGQELPAQIVLRDKDLDLAFLRPSQKPATPLPALDMTQEGKPEMLDRVVILNRMGKVANRVPTVAIDRVRAIVEKPRTFYIPSGNAMEGGLGAPVFLLNGKVAGLLVMRMMMSPSEGFSMGAMFGGASRMGMQPVILPARDIVEAAQQAPTSVPEKKEEKKPDAKAGQPGSAEKTK